MSDKKEIKEIDVASLDSELAAARTLEEGKGDKFIMMASVVAFLMTSFHIYTGFFGLFDYSVQRGVHLGFALTLILLTQPLYKHVFKDKFAGSKAFRAACRTFDMILVVLTWVSVWMAQDEVHHLTERLSKTTWMATFAGACLVIIVLECARRTLGYIMPVLALIFIAYALAGPNLPMAIAHRGYSLERICKFLATDLDGLFGTTMSVSATVIFMFVMFGAFLEASGCSDFINDIAISLTGKIKSGPALSAVVASGLMGSINGSAVANVVGTGTFTIPLMKSRGYKPQFAGGVEAVASTGGQILPPVMGSGAFLMVAFTEQKYIAIVIAAVIPALLYYWGCAVAVMSQTEIAHVTLMDPKDIPKSREVMKDGWIYLLIIAVLLYCLLVAQYSPLYSALWATCAVPVVMLFDKKKRFTLKTIPSAMVKSGFSAMSIVIGCACAGIVVGMVSITGIGVIFGDMMIQAAHGLLFPSLLFTAITWHRPRYGPAHHRGLCYRGVHPRSVPHQARSCPADGTPVRVLLRVPVRHYPAGRPRGLCRRRHRQDQPDDHGGRGMQARLRRLHGALRVLLQPGNDDAGQRRRDHLRRHQRDHRRCHHVRRLPGLAAVEAQLA